MHVCSELGTPDIEGDPGAYPHDVIRQADEMMYMVKNSTRDNIGIAQRGMEK